MANSVNMLVESMSNQPIIQQVEKLTTRTIRQSNAIMKAKDKFLLDTCAQI